MKFVLSVCDNFQYKTRAARHSSIVCIYRLHASAIVIGTDSVHKQFILFSNCTHCDKSSCVTTLRFSQKLKFYEL